MCRRAVCAKVIPEVSLEGVLRVAGWAVLSSVTGLLAFLPAAVAGAFDGLSPAAPGLALALAAAGGYAALSILVLAVGILSPQAG